VSISIRYLSYRASDSLTITQIRDVKELGFVFNIQSSRRNNRGRLKGTGWEGAELFADIVCVIHTHSAILMIE
jgi:hypothetical protein